MNATLNLRSTNLAHLELRAARLIRQKIASGTKLHKLMEDINAANERAHTHFKVNDALLKKLKLDESVGLTRQQQIALAAYFTELLLQPPFVIPGVFDALVGTPRLAFMLGAKSRREERRNDISHWDARSFKEIFGACSKRDSHHQFSIEFVPWRTPVVQESLNSEPWVQALEDNDTSVVSFGSPLVSLSSEMMLARMFDVKPFDSPHFDPAKHVPFCFVWRPKISKGFASAFGPTVKGVQAFNPKLANEVRKNQASAFILGDKIHKVSVAGNSWTIYGIIAAQRRAAGNAWLVISGLAGPATWGAAMKVKDIMEELPWSMGQPSKVLWVPVRVEVIVGKGSPEAGDIREVRSAAFDGPVRIWPP